MQETPYRTLELGAQCLAAQHASHDLQGRQSADPPGDESARRFRSFVQYADTTTPDGAGSRDGSPPGAAHDADEPGRALANARRRRRVRQDRRSPRRPSGARAPSERHHDDAAARRRRRRPPRRTCATKTAPPSGRLHGHDGLRGAGVFLRSHARRERAALSRLPNIVHSWAGVTQGHHTVSHLDGDHRTRASGHRSPGTALSSRTCSRSSIPSARATARCSTIPSSFGVERWAPRPTR